MFWYIDPVYVWYVLIPTLLISLGVQLFLQSSFRKWSNIRNGVNLNGVQVGKRLFEQTALNPIPVQPIQGTLNDHYDPVANVVRLSEPVSKHSSVAAMAVTAHELGHVQQYQSGSAMIKARNVLLPALQFSPTISYFCILLGLLFNLPGLYSLGIIFFALMVVFSLLTLPIEINASRRGLRLLREAGMIKTDNDRKGSRQVLTAAALTYLAAAITSILQLLYYVAVARRG
jgi:hypothetical protein